MEADWEFEIGPGASVIDAHWEGFVDLGAHPERASALQETADLPALAEALILLNSAGSPVWTSKCDFWPIDLGENHLDPDELDAPSGTLTSAHACYMDLLCRPAHLWSDPHVPERYCVALYARLRSIPLRSCRADLVIRKAVLIDSAVFGITAYLTACGPSAQVSISVLAHALHAFSDSASAPHAP